MVMVMMMVAVVEAAQVVVMVDDEIDGRGHGTVGLRPPICQPVATPSNHKGGFPGQPTVNISAHSGNGAVGARISLLRSFRAWSRFAWCLLAAERFLLFLSASCRQVAASK